MFHQWNRQASRSHLSGLVFHHTAVFFLLTHCCGGRSKMVGPSKPILAMLGDDVILPCHLEPATDIVSETLEWAGLNLNPRFVHVRREGVELLLNQNPLYLGRTSLSTNKLKCGDMSLTLSRVRLTDEGTYRCHIPALGTSQVQLVVGSLSSPVVIIAEIDRSSNELVLQCESKGWYPEPEVLWLDGEGNLLTAGPTESTHTVIRGPDDLYTVSSRVTVEKRHSNSFTCRVQQKNINQTRETQIRILDEVFMASSCSAGRISVILSVVCVLLLFSAAFIFLWKRRQNKSDNKKHHDEETEDGTGEREELVTGHEEMRDLDEERLQEKEEEKKNIIHVMSVLMEQKKELENSRDKQRSWLQEVETERWQNEKKLKKVEKKYSWDKNDQKIELLEAKQELDNKKREYEKSFLSTAERLNKTEDVITKVTDWKDKVDNQIEQMNKQLEETKRRRDEEIHLQSEQLERETEETNQNTDSLTLTEGHFTQPTESSSHPSPETQST